MASRVDPDLVGPYRIQERLGRGGMGVVYRATHLRTGALAAVKTVLVPNERHLGAIRREIQALARVNHPGVVRIVDEGLDGEGLPWYAMELLQGMTLREYRFVPGDVALSPREGYWAMNLASRATRSADVSNGAPPLPPAKPTDVPLAPEQRAAVLGIFRKLCAPLAFVHGEGLVHCDLKPENVFLRYDGRPVLVDFGLISRFGTDLHREVLDVDLFMGTAEYMAPEQWEGKPVDARTDLYALGCILFEALAGAPPFRGDRGTLYTAHLTTPAPRLSSFAEDVAPGLDELLSRLLAKNPRDRIGHADEVERLLGALGAEGISEPGPSARPYLFRPSFSGRGQATTDVVTLVSASSEEGRVVILEGESGVGKTRLAMEAARMAKRGGIRVLTGECSPVVNQSARSQGTVLHPFQPLLLHVADLVRERGSTTFDDLLNGRALVLARVEPQIMLLEDARRLPSLVPLSADAERARMLSALMETLAALGREKRTFLLIDDVQWADELTHELLHFLVQRADSWKNIVILATCRSEEVPERIRALLEQPSVGHVRLGRLSPQAVGTLVADMLGFPPPDPFSAFLTRQTGGNPFFVAEYLRAAMTRGLLVRDQLGKWTVTLRDGHYDELGLPNTLVDLLALRLESLGVEARAFIDAAAILGREAPAPLIGRVAGRSERMTRDGIEELLRKQILEESIRGRLRFAHDKLREVTYERLDAGRRVDGHRRAAEAIEAIVESPSPAALAYHWEEGGEPQRAVGYLEEAAKVAIGAGAHHEAANHLERLIALAGPPGPKRSDRRRAAGWHRRLGEAQLAAGALDTSRAHAERALALLELPLPSTKGEWVAKLFGELSRQLLHRLLPTTTYEEPERRLLLAEATQASGTVARIAFFENDALQIVASALWSINLAERAGHLLEAARNYSGLGWVFGLSGLHRIADGYFERARRTGVEHHDYSGLVFTLTSEAVYRIGRAQFDRAIEALAACEAPVAKLGDPQARELVETLRGHPDFFAGRYDAAIARHRFVLDSARSRQNRQHEAWSLYCAARSALALGRHEEAIEDLEEAAQLLESQTDLLSQITCHGLLASARCRAGDLEGAIEAAKATDEAIGGRPATVFLTLHGYEGIVEVAIARLAAAPPEERRALRREATRALRRLDRVARTFPVGAPRAAELRARLRETVGLQKGSNTSDDSVQRG